MGAVKVRLYQCEACDHVSNKITCAFSTPPELTMCENCGMPSQLIQPFSVPRINLGECLSGRSVTGGSNAHDE
jgi:hypothetical protein